MKTFQQQVNERMQELAGVNRVNEGFWNDIKDKWIEGWRKGTQYGTPKSFYKKFLGINYRDNDSDGVGINIVYSKEQDDYYMALLQGEEFDGSSVMHRQAIIGFSLDNQDFSLVISDPDRVLYKKEEGGLSKSQALDLVLKYLTDRK